MTKFADPEEFFALRVSLAAVRHEDYDAASTALSEVIDQFCWGGSTVSVERVGASTVVHDSLRKRRSTETS